MLSGNSAAACAGTVVKTGKIHGLFLPRATSVLEDAFPVSVEVMGRSEGKKVRNRAGVEADITELRNETRDKAASS